VDGEERIDPDDPEFGCSRFSNVVSDSAPSLSAPSVSLFLFRDFPGDEAEVDVMAGLGALEFEALLPAADVWFPVPLTVELGALESDVDCTALANSLTIRFVPGTLRLVPATMRRSGFAETLARGEGVFTTGGTDDEAAETAEVA
jgi:hypothetical protein